jgi:hypothetical protein
MLLGLRYVLFSVQYHKCSQTGSRMLNPDGLCWQRAWRCLGRAAPRGKATSPDRSGSGAAGWEYPLSMQ